MTLVVTPGQASASLLDDAPAEPAAESTRAHDSETELTQLRQQLVVVESVLLRVLENPPPHRVDDEVSVHLLGVQATARPEDAMDLAKSITPRRHMMNDPEVEHGVVGFLAGTAKDQCPAPFLGREDQCTWPIR